MESAPDAFHVPMIGKVDHYTLVACRVACPEYRLIIHSEEHIGCAVLLSPDCLTFPEYPDLVWREFSNYHRRQVRCRTRSERGIHFLRLSPQP